MMNLGHFHPQSSPSSLTLSPGTLLNRPPLCSCLPFAHSLQSLVTWQTVGGRLLGSKHKTSVTLSLKKITLPLPSKNWPQQSFWRDGASCSPSSMVNVERPKCSSGCLYRISIRLGPSTPTLQEGLALSLPTNMTGPPSASLWKEAVKTPGSLSRMSEVVHRPGKCHFENDSDTW